MFGLTRCSFETGSKVDDPDTASTDSSSTTSGSTSGTGTTSTSSSSTGGSENTSQLGDSGSMGSEDSSNSSGSSGGSESTNSTNGSESSASEDSSDTEESCIPHSTQCFGSLHLQTCTAEGMWGVPQPCGLKEKCEQGECVETCESWIQQIGTQEADRGTGIAVDKDGVLYITGYTYGKLEGKPSGGRDIFLAKYDAREDEIRFDQFGTTEDEESRGIAVDRDGNAYISGYTEGVLDPSGVKEGRDIFITKYNSDGVRSWTKQSGSSRFDASSGVAVDSSGAAYITGFEARESDGKGLIFVAKYVGEKKEDANEVWNSIGLANDEMEGAGHDIALDGQGNIYIAGSSSLSGNEKLRDIVIAKFSSSDGKRLWKKITETNTGDEAHGIAVDSEGNAYITGFEEATLSRGTKVGLDIFVDKYDTHKNQLWTKSLSTKKNDYGTAVALDAEGNVYITGYTEGALGPSGPKGGRDIVIAKYSSSGTELWVQQIGTTGTEEGSGIIIGDDGGIYVTGYTNGTLGQKHFGFDDIFIAKVCEEKN